MLWYQIINPRAVYEAVKSYRNRKEKCDAMLAKNELKRAPTRGPPRALARAGMEKCCVTVA